MHELTFTGDVDTFIALKVYLEFNAPPEFEGVIKKLNEALDQHKIDCEFEPIGRILRLQCPDSYNVRTQIYIDGGIDTHIGHFSGGFSGDRYTYIPKMVLEIIKKLNLSESEVHVTEDFFLDASDEGVPEMLMVIHAGKYAGTLIRLKLNENLWVRPDAFMFTIGCIPWKRYNSFKDADDFIQQLNTAMVIR